MMDLVSKRWLIASMFIFFIAIMMNENTFVILLYGLCMIWWAVKWRIAGINELKKSKKVKP